MTDKPTPPTPPARSEVTPDDSKASSPEIGKPDASSTGRKNRSHETRFKPGVSGNRHGRPVGRKSFKTELREVVEESIAVRVNGAMTNITSRKAFLLSMRQKAFAGDRWAMDRLFRMIEQHLPDQEVRDTGKSAKEDAEFLRRLLAEDERNDDNDS